MTEPTVYAICITDNLKEGDRLRLILGDKVIARYIYMQDRDVSFQKCILVPTYFEIERGEQ